MRKFAGLAVAASVIALLAFAGSALAGSKTIKQTGQIVGDKATNVKLRVKVKNGEAIKVSGFAADGVKTRCDGDIVRFKYNSLSPIPVVSDKFKIKLVGDAGAVLKVQGKVKDHGTAAKGSLKTNKFEAGGKTCKSPKQKFKTAA